VNLPPTGYFKTISARGAKSLGFYCPACRLLLYHVTNSRGVFHCREWQERPGWFQRLPEYRIEAPCGDHEVAPGILKVGTW
jgi:hypothetical protein